MTTHTETKVQYHRDGFSTARPAINVKMRGLPWQQPAVQELERNVGTPQTEDLLEAAEEKLFPRWWEEAARKAETLGLGPITQEGRSGGWLVFTDGRDPQDMQAELDDAHDDADANEVLDERARLTDWLAAYRQMVKWCNAGVRAMPQRLAECAVTLERAERIADVMVWPNGYQEGVPDGGGVTEERPIIARCLWCGQGLVDGAEESGYTGEGPDYMLPDGDFGCGDSPDTNDDGTGSHTSDEVETKDGHLVRIDSYTHIRALWPEREAAALEARRALLNGEDFTATADAIMGALS